MKIKVCGIANPEFIEQVHSLPIDFVGFIFYTQSKRYVMNGMFVDLIRSIPSTINKVGVFVNESLDKIQNLSSLYLLDYIQLHGDEDLNYVKEISQQHKIIKAFRINDEFDFNDIIQFEKYCDYFLFDTRGKLYGGTGEKFNWQILEKYKGKTPFLLSGGIKPEDREEINAINHPKLAGIDINSGFEIKPGIKNLQLIKEFLKQLS